MLDLDFMNRSYKRIPVFLMAIIIAACSSDPDSSDNLKFTTHQSKTPVLIGKEQNAILNIRLEISDVVGSQVVEQISISTKGTTDLTDIASVNLFYSGDSSDFGTVQQFGVSTAPAGEVIFRDILELAAGVNNFWVSYELAPHADLLHKVDAVCEGIILNSQTIKPDIKPPPFVQRIGHALRKHGDDDVDTYRIPGLVTTNHGTLIGVYDIRRNSSVDLQEDIDVGMSRSTDGGQTWETMKVIIDMGQWDGKPQIENGIGDPSILVDRKTNTIWVAGIWAHGHPGERNWFASGQGLEPDETSQFILVKSEDDGVSWSEPINITKQIKDPKWRLLLAGPGKGITLKDGTLVFPSQFKDEKEVPHASIIYSKDRGVTWKMGAGVREETTEAQVVELKDGSIMINARNNEARDNRGVGRVVATTRNLGQSWQQHPSSIKSLEESTCMASLISESFDGIGKILLFSNPNTHTGRFNTTIKISFDGGLTWPENQWFLLDEGDSNGYSCMTKIDEKTIGILYEGSQAHMVFEKLTIDEILNH